MLTDNKFKWKDGTHKTSLSLISELKGIFPIEVIEVDDLVGKLTTCIDDDFVWVKCVEKWYDR